MIPEKIGFIGAGNMAQAVVQGLLKQGCLSAQIYLYDIDKKRLVQLQQTFGVHISPDLAVLKQRCDMIVLAVKPAQMPAACGQLSGKELPLILSLAAGVSIANIQAWLRTSTNTAIIRLMPNTAATLGEGVTGAYANVEVSGTQKQQAQQILDAMGVSIWVDKEDKINAITALSGSGPAYYFYFIEAMVAAGVGLGLNLAQCYQLSVQTLKGAALLAGQKQSLDECIQLKKQVSSPGGTTEAALKTLDKLKVSTHFQSAIKAAYQRAIELS